MREEEAGCKSVKIARRDGTGTLGGSGPHGVASLHPLGARDARRLPGMGFVLDCVSDTHDAHADLVFPAWTPPAGYRRLLLHAGDFSYGGREDEVSRFVGWLRALPHDRKVVIAGNHELSFDGATPRRDRTRPLVSGAALFAGVADYLEEESIEIEGLRVFGSPYSVRFFDWAFQTDPGLDAETRWAKIPEGTHVALIHGPPHGFGDVCRDHRANGNLVHVGDEALLARLRFVKPLACIFGHIHEGFGTFTEPVSGTLLVNASSLDEGYAVRGTFVRLIIDDALQLVSQSVEQFAPRASP